MTLEQTTTIDASGIDRETRGLVLTITDAWGWSEEETPEHLCLLQEKLNAYVAAIETGEVFERFHGRSEDPSHLPVRISVRAVHPPSPLALRVFAGVHQSLARYGIEFEHIVGSG